MSDKKLVNVKVEEETKDEWQNYVEESNSVSSLSDLIRLSVTKEMKDSSSPENTDTEHLEQINSTLTDIKDSIGELDNRVAKVEASTQDNPEIDRLANEIFPLLPDSEPGTDAWQSRLNDLEKQSSHGVEGANQTKNAWKGTVEGLVQALDSDEWQVRQALEKLVSDLARVRVTEYGGKERYWRDI